MPIVYMGKKKSKSFAKLIPAINVTGDIDGNINIYKKENNVNDVGGYPSETKDSEIKLSMTKTVQSTIN